MHIAELTRRTQLLLDEDRYQRLQRHAEATNRSIAALVRDAIDIAYPARSMSPAEAMALLRDAPLADHGSPEDVKRDILERHEPR